MKNTPYTLQEILNASKDNQVFCDSRLLQIVRKLQKIEDSHPEGKKIQITLDTLYCLHKGNLRGKLRAEDQYSNRARLVISNEKGLNEETYPFLSDAEEFPVEVRKQFLRFFE
jgi:hypothetical protein